MFSFDSKSILWSKTLSNAIYLLFRTELFEFDLNLFSISTNITTTTISNAPSTWTINIYRKMLIYTIAKKLYLHLFYIKYFTKCSRWDRHLVSKSNYIWSTISNGAVFIHLVLILWNFNSNSFSTYTHVFIWSVRIVHEYSSHFPSSLI